LSVHQASNSCLDRPLCIIPGLAMITHGPMSSNWSMFCIIWWVEPKESCDNHVTIMWQFFRPWDLKCAWIRKDLMWQSDAWFCHSWHQWTSDTLQRSNTHTHRQYLLTYVHNVHIQTCHVLLSQLGGVVYGDIVKLRVSCPVLIWNMTRSRSTINNI
jgi:hypothetical protein